MATENNQDTSDTEEAKVKKAKSRKGSEKVETVDSSDFDKFESTAEIPVSDKVIDQIIGQERAVNIIKKASSQKRNVLLIGSPGTGKSMLAQAMAELLPVEALEDILVYQNSEDENAPVIKVVKAGEGRKMLQANRMKARMSGSNVNLIIMAVVILVSFLLLFYARPHLGDIITAALLIGLFVMSAMLTFATQIGKGKLMPGMEHEQMKLLVDNHDKKKAPFVDATGARAGALLGDCRHDPLQSGGLGTPAHLRIEAGAIHRANKGVLFVDEVATIKARSQQELLTAMQEKKYSITGQSEMSSGALVKTQAVPCDFVLIAAGNYSDIKYMHPALRSRIRGYGYEVYMDESIQDTKENRMKICKFIAQEVKKDGKIPHFEREAVMEIINEARKRSGRKGKLTLKLRELGGLIRAAGDIAQQEGAKYATLAHVELAKKLSQTLEQQVASQMLEQKKDYKVFTINGKQIGKVNGLAVMGDSGIVLPIVAEIAPSSSKEEGRIIATGKLGSIAKEAVENVSAIIKKHTGKDISSYDIHVQFLQTYEGVEGDSASISVATAVISALEEAPILQNIAMTGSLSVRGEVLPIGGVTQKAEAAINAGIKTIIIPKSNYGDLVLSPKQLKAIEIVPVENIVQVLQHALAPSNKKKSLLEKIRIELK